MGNKFHPKCFVCTYCRKPFKDRKYKSDDEFNHKYNDDFNHNSNDEFIHKSDRHRYHDQSRPTQQLRWRVHPA